MLAELVDLPQVIGQGQLARLLEVARDRVGAGEVDDRAQVCHPLAVEKARLVGVVTQAILEPVREARLAEAAVPPGCPEPDPFPLEDRDAERRIGLEEAQRRPQPREPGPNDRNVGGRGAGKGRGPRVIPAGEPVAHGARRVDGLHRRIVPDARGPRAGEPAWVCGDDAAATSSVAAALRRARCSSRPDTEILANDGLEISVGCPSRARGRHRQPASHSGVGTLANAAHVTHKRGNVPAPAAPDDPGRPLSRAHSG